MLRPFNLAITADGAHYSGTVSIVPDRSSPRLRDRRGIPWPIHTKAEVVKRGSDYGIEFEFDDGGMDYVEVGERAIAEWYASAQLSEEITVGISPVLLSAENAEKLRRR
jgi:hypothetical protein